MFRISEDSLKITLTKGDSANMGIKIYSIDDKEYIFKPDDILKFSVKKAGATTSVLTKIANEEHMFILVPNDTKNLSSGNYLFDVQLTTEEGQIYTVIQDGVFQLKGEITNE